MSNTTTKTIGNSIAARQWLRRGRTYSTESAGEIAVHLLDSRHGNLEEVWDFAQLAIETYGAIGLDGWDKRKVYQAVLEDVGGMMSTETYLKEQNDGQTEFTEIEIIKAMAERTWKDDDGLMHWTKLDGFATEAELDAVVAGLNQAAA